jgi:DNA modification methylase
MNLAKIPTNEINPAPYNPRKDLKPTDPEYLRIKKSLLEFGMVEPIVWNRKTGHLVGGHQRFKILMEDQPEELEVSVVYLDEKKEKALNVALNKVAGEFDFPKLKELLVELDDGEFDLSLTGFDEGELKDLIDYEGKRGLTEDDDAPEPPAAANTKTKRGDIYELGAHRLMCGDSVNVDDVKSLMEGQMADMVFTDPPYNIDYGNIKHPKFKQRSIENDSLNEKDWETFCRDVAFMISSFSEGCVYVCHAPGPDGRVMATILDQSFHASTTVVWVKDQFTLGRGKYHNQYEPIWFGWVKDGSNFSDRRDLSNVWNVARPKKSVEHPTMKPVELVQTAINQASKQGQIVLDLFGGSGSTMIAAEKTGRRAFLMELDPAYCDVIVRRWETFTGKKAKLLQQVVSA